jgi:hypothetical protein
MVEMAKEEPRSSRKTQLPLLEFAAQVIEARLKELVAYDATVRQPDAVSELHEMRIAAKRLRYTLELFREIYVDSTTIGPLYDEVIEGVKLLQEHLGGVHDADVLVPELTDYLERQLKPHDPSDAQPSMGAHQVDFDACAGVVTICRQLQAARDRHYQQALVAWSRLENGARLLELQELLTAAADVNAQNAPTHRNISAAAVLTEETGNGRHTHNGPTKAESATSRRRRARTRNGSGRTIDPKDGVRHSGSGADSRARPDKSGAE